MKKKYVLNIERLREVCLRIEDPRRQSGNIRHRLVDILIITLLAVICYAETWEEIEEYAQLKHYWLKKILDLDYGVPSADTYRRVLSRVSADALEQVYREWVRPYVDTCMGKQVAFDGKTSRGVAKGSGNEVTLHTVSAWVKEDRITLGQLQVEEKSNEITAIPALLDRLDVGGAVVSGDAMVCQKEIARKIRERDAQYVLALKGNHPTLHEEVSEYFRWALEDPIERQRIDVHRETEQGHGRITTWTTHVTTEIDWYEGRRDWEGLRSFVMVNRKRWVKGAYTEETSYYISSLEASAEQCGRYVRGHWSIENQLHWVMDVVFREDASLIHEGNAPQNLSLLRKMSLALLKKDTEHRRSLKTKRKMAGWDNGYAMSLLSGL